MTLKLNGLATAVTFAFATAAAAQTPPTTTTQTTTTQTQPTTSQSQPATTTQTTTQSQQTTSETGATAKATAADIKAGASVHDQAGALVGKVDSVDADGAIVNTGKARAEIPLSSFGKNDKGLVVSVTKADLDAQAKKETKKETKPKS